MKRKQEEVLELLEVFELSSEVMTEVEV